VLNSFRGNWERWGRHLHKVIREGMTMALENTDIKPNQALFLWPIAERPDLTQEELTREVLVDKATTARSIKQLMLRGYVTRRKDPCDKRIYRLALTPRGIDLVERMSRLKWKWLDAVFEGFTPEERHAIEDVMSRMVEKAEQLNTRIDALMSPEAPEKEDHPVPIAVNQSHGMDRV